MLFQLKHIPLNSTFISYTITSLIKMKIRKFSCFLQDVNLFREFILVKLINAEKATFQTPIFSQKRERTLEMLIKDLHEDYIGDSKLVSKRIHFEVLEEKRTHTKTQQAISAIPSQNKDNTTFF